jgi:dihydropteroate synthase
VTRFVPPPIPLPPRAGRRLAALTWDDVCVMGVVNVTPDSFSDGGLFLDAGAAVEHGRRLAAEGAAILDIGGESTRPGSEGVPEDEELRRVLPVVEQLAGGEARISIDTTKSAVARAALEAGATIVNDVSGFRFDPELPGVVAAAGADCCLMHMLGEPRTMQDDPRYDDVVSDVKSFLEERLAFAVDQGIEEERVWLDPGIGFGKNTRHNLDLLAHLDAVVALGFPVCVGVSRKRFLGELLAASDGVDLVDADDRREGSLAATTTAIVAGATMVRVHDVRMTVHAARVVAAAV